MDYSKEDCFRVWINGNPPFFKNKFGQVILKKSPKKQKNLKQKKKQ